MTSETNSADLIDHAAEIVAAYVSKNALPAAELPALIQGVYGALTALSSEEPKEPTSVTQEEVAKPTPAQIRKSITPDALISFIDGRPYKTLKRHLGVHDLTPEAYRARYGLPADYPMVSPGYSAQRSALAKQIGLGQIRSQTAQAAE